MSETLPVATQGPPPAGSGATHDIRGDVGANGQAIQHDGHLRISGSICTASTVNVSKSLDVGGTIEAATVTAGGSITVCGGIVGRGKGRCLSQGDITARSANAAHLEAAANIIAEVEIANSRLIAGGDIRCPNAHIYGGHATANGGLTCAVLGSSGGSTTLVEVGVDEALRRLGETRAPEIEANQRRVALVRTQVEPLMAHQKSLTAKQKETATELLYNAEELEASTNALIAELRVAVVDSCARSKQEVVVSRMLYPGVTIRFASLEIKFDRGVKGPFRINVDGRGGSSKVTLTDLTSEAITIPKYTLYTDPHLAALFRLLVTKKSAASETDHRAA